MSFGRNEVNFNLHNWNGSRGDRVLECEVEGRDDGHFLIKRQRGNRDPIDGSRNEEDAGLHRSIQGSVRIMARIGMRSGK